MGDARVPWAIAASHWPRLSGILVPLRPLGPALCHESALSFALGWLVHVPVGLAELMSPASRLLPVSVSPSEALTAVQAVND